jgi:hypothetical protein
VGARRKRKLREGVGERARAQPGHAWVAQHYQWALDRLFNDKQHSHVILVEDDMLFAVDFLRYFEATATLLDVDPTLWCSSSTLSPQPPSR